MNILKALEMDSYKSNSFLVLEDIVKTKPIYGRKIFFWQIENMDSIMLDGVQRAITCEFEVKNSVPEDPLGCISKWKLALDMDDVEPAVTVHKVSPVDKDMYFRLSLRAMKSVTEETDVINEPNGKLFYESTEFTGVSVPGKATRKFRLHKKLDYGCSYTTWFKDVLVEGSLLLRVSFETCESVCY